VCAHSRGYGAGVRFRRATPSRGAYGGRRAGSIRPIIAAPGRSSEYQNPVRNPYGLLPRPPQTQAAHFKRLYRK
jgi:hypothetical protein